MSTLPVLPYTGTKDFYPDDKRVEDYIKRIWINTIQSYGYEEYKPPLIEPAQLYKNSLNLEYVEHNVYKFIDRSDNEVAIRPTLKPSASRMIARKHENIILPARWYSTATTIQYNRKNVDNLREKSNLNVDIFGVSTVDAEIELLLIAYDIFNRFSLNTDDINLRINSRKLVALIMGEYLQLDIQQSHQIIDLLNRKNNINSDIYIDEIKNIIPKEETANKLRRILQAKSLAQLPLEIQNSAPIKAIQVLFTHLNNAHVKNIKFDIALMGEFNYFTDLVFEISYRNKDTDLRLVKGGRTDNLIGSFGVDNTSMTGFEMDIQNIEQLLRIQDLIPKFSSSVDLYIAPEEEVIRESQGIAKLLRQEGISVIVDTSKKSQEEKTMSAKKRGIKNVLFINEKDLSREVFRIKNHDDADIVELSIPKIINYCRKNS